MRLEEAFKDLAGSDIDKILGIVNNLIRLTSSSPSVDLLPSTHNDWSGLWTVMVIRSKTATNIRPIST